MARAAAQFTFSETPRLDAELLMAHALGVSRDEMLLRGLADIPTPLTFTELAARRAAHEPIAYVLGKRAFRTIELQVGPGALVPRADSETLVEAAVDHFTGTPGPARVLDLGTGPGTLLLAALAEWPQATGLGIDSSARALAWAWRNVAALGMSGRARFLLGDWATRIADRFDLILANPPYIGTVEPLPAEVGQYEPPSALYAGTDGLDAYRAIIPDIPRLLAPGGVAILEIGWTQAEAVTALVEAQGLAAMLRRDLAGHPRAILAA
ncbi:peptide chain release factor N(5)-glutamine methyltransferase [Sphingomonas sp. DT-204]|uniref:peptide chain release factor N(5)-glutamine methyltransferase n=1 Tax=Sphingomonas sp. DT-204 TaxID=3396166 RepID=UPI003F1AB668